MCPRIYRKSVLHLLKWTWNMRSSRCSTDLGLYMKRSILWFVQRGLFPSRCSIYEFHNFTNALLKSKVPYLVQERDFTINPSTTWMIFFYLFKPYKIPNIVQLWRYQMSSKKFSLEHEIIQHFQQNLKTKRRVDCRNSSKII